MPIKGSGKGDDIGKIFVGGLAPATDKEKLQSYFEKFGPVTDCVLMTDPVTKHSRGFGFVTFNDPQTVSKVVESAIHDLDGKRIDPKPAVPRGPGQSLQTGNVQKSNNNELKVFIGGLAHGTTEEEIKDYFMKHYGKYTSVKNVQLIADKATNKLRGFGFVTFDTSEGVDRTVDKHFHPINGKMVEVKRAEERPKQMNNGPFGGQGNPLATPTAHGMQGAMSRGQYGQPPYMGQGGYQQGGGMQGVGRGGYGANAGYGFGASQGFGYGSPQGPQAYGASSMAMGGAPNASAASYTPGYGGAAQMSGYGVGAGRDPTAAYGQTPAYGSSYPSAGALAQGAPPPGSTDYGQGMPVTSSSLSGQGAGVPSHGEAAAGGDYTAAYSNYGLGNYQQQDSQYGPARGTFGSETSYSGYPSNDSYSTAATAASYGGSAGAAESFGRGGGAARGFHPYGR